MSPDISSQVVLALADELIFKMSGFITPSRRVTDCRRVEPSVTLLTGGRQ